MSWNSYLQKNLMLPSEKSYILLRKVYDCFSTELQRVLAAKRWRLLESFFKNREKNVLFVNIRLDAFFIRPLAGFFVKHSATQQPTASLRYWKATVRLDKLSILNATPPNFHSTCTGRRRDETAVGWNFSTTQISSIFQDKHLIMFRKQLSLSSLTWITF